MSDTAVTLTTKKDWSSDQEVRWCPGCGDYGVLQAVQQVMPELGVAPENTVFVSGIGCSSRFPYYMNTYGMHTIHGRAPAIATGSQPLALTLTSGWSLVMVTGSQSVETTSFMPCDATSISPYCCSTTAYTGSPKASTHQLPTWARSRSRHRLAQSTLHSTHLPSLSGPKHHL